MQLVLKLPVKQEVDPGIIIVLWYYSPMEPDSPACTVKHRQSAHTQNESDAYSVYPSIVSVLLGFGDEENNHTCTSHNTNLCSGFQIYILTLYTTCTTHQQRLDEQNDLYCNW